MLETNLCVFIMREQSEAVIKQSETGSAAHSPRRGYQYWDSFHCDWRAGMAALCQERNSTKCQGLSPLLSKKRRWGSMLNPWKTRLLAL